MYYGNYTDGLIAGRQQGHQVGYDEGHSDGRKKVSRSAMTRRGMKRVG